MKGKSLEKSYNLLVLNNFEEMELILTKRLLSYFGKLLPLQSSYLDWLVFKLRPIRKQNNFQLGLNSDYIRSEIALNPKTLIQFIQFLNYATNLDYTIVNWDGAYFYKLAKNKQIQWNLFNSGVLSRFDLNDLRPLQSDQVHSVTQFLRTSQEEIRRKRINAKLESSFNEEILKIASRRSSRCARIYTTDNSLKFEIELRNNLIKDCNYLLVAGSFEELESKLVEEYISYFGKLLPFQYSYTDWLAEKLRPFRVNLKRYSQPTLCSDYLRIESQTMVGSLEPKKFILFLKFLKFSSSLDSKTEIFDGDPYRVVIFRVKDFLDVSHSHYNSQDEYYKMQKTKDFLQDLQQNLFVKCFTDDYFKSLVTVPKLEVYKCKKSKCWVTRVLLLEELFDYQYPFKYPDLFEIESIKFNKDQYLVRFEVGSAADNIKNRPIFYSLIDNELTQNDLLFVTKIDRCSRNTLEFLKLQERLHKKGVTFISLDLPYSNDMAVNKLISTNLAAIGTFENERRKERQRQGIQAAKKNGKYLGRKTVITKKLIAQVQDLKENKKLSITEIAKITGRGRNTIYKVLKKELNYIPYNRLVKNVNQEETNESK